MADYAVRPATLEDLAALTDIYNHYVATTAITFDLRTFTVATRRGWFDDHAATGPHRLLVATDPSGECVGYVTRLEQQKWTPPVRVHADNWVINACPDNGPALDARESSAVIAWWTMAGGMPSVKVAFSPDAGSTWGSPVRVDHGKGSGQVTVAMLPDRQSAVVGWLEDRQTWARLVRADGSATEAVSLGRSPSRNRLPRWVASDKGVLALWTRDDDGGAVSTQVAALRPSE